MKEDLFIERASEAIFDQLTNADYHICQIVSEKGFEALTDKRKTRYLKQYDQARIAIKVVYAFYTEGQVAELAFRVQKAVVELVQKDIESNRLSEEESLRKS